MAAIAGPYAGRIAEVAVSNAAVTTTAGATFVDIERVNSPRFPGSTDTAESSSNDSGGAKEYLPTWTSGTFAFEIIADETATGQEHLWTQFEDAEIRAFRYRPRGAANVGSIEYTFLGIITAIEHTSDKGDVSKYTVTVQRTGAIGRAAQSV